MPGNYAIVASLGEANDTTWITIADDPRLGDRTAVRLAQQALRDQLMQLAQPLTDAMDRLSEAEEAVGRIETAYKDDKGAMADSIRRSTKAVQDSIKGIREFISGKRSTAQGYGQVPRVTVMSQFQQALQAIGARPLEPGIPEKSLVEQAGRQMSVAVSRIDAWLKGSWGVYQELVKAHQPDLFRSR
jgi:methyl-accepting chemotaxis protein